MNSIHAHTHTHTHKYLYIYHQAFMYANICKYWNLIYYKLFNNHKHKHNNKFNDIDTYT